MTYLVKRHDIVTVVTSLQSLNISKSNRDFDSNETALTEAINENEIDSQSKVNEGVSTKQNYQDDTTYDVGEIEIDNTRASSAATTEDGTKSVVEFEWHVVYSPTFQVPTLYFNINQLGNLHAFSLV